MSPKSIKRCENSSVSQNRDPLKRRYQSGTRFEKSAKRSIPKREKVIFWSKKCSFELDGNKKNGTFYVRDGWDRVWWELRFELVAKYTAVCTRGFHAIFTKLVQTEFIWLSEIQILLIPVANFPSDYSLKKCQFLSKKSHSPAIVSAV